MLESLNRRVTCSPLTQRHCQLLATEMLIKPKLLKLYTQQFIRGQFMPVQESLYLFAAVLGSARKAGLD